MEMKAIFSQRLCTLREAKGKEYTRQRVANDLNISRASLEYYEKGQRLPDVEIAAKIADYYNVSVDYLLGRAENSLKESEAKDLHFYKKLSDEAIENLETLFRIEYSKPDTSGYFMPVPLAETCNTFFSSPLFFDFISILSELLAHSKQQIDSCGFSMKKSGLTCQALNISRSTFDKLIGYIKPSCEDSIYREVFSKLENDEVACKRIFKSFEDDKECDLTRYKLVGLVEKINDIFDYRNIITASREEKERFLNLLTITESEVRELDYKTKEESKCEEGD